MTVERLRDPALVGGSQMSVPVGLGTKMGTARKRPTTERATRPARGYDLIYLIPHLLELLSGTAKADTRDIKGRRKVASLYQEGAEPLIVSDAQRSGLYFQLTGKGRSRILSIFRRATRYPLQQLINGRPEGGHLFLLQPDRHFSRAGFDQDAKGAMARLAKRFSLHSQGETEIQRWVIHARLYESSVFSFRFSVFGSR